jgi:D-alanyl-D-alanine carboxypeptidase (penicillin-binding protein 5/6)
VKRHLLVALAALVVSTLLGVATAAATAPFSAQRPRADVAVVKGTTYRPRTDTVPAPPGVRGRSWLVADMDTGTLLAKHDPRRRLPQASTIKLLTALTARYRVPADRPVVATRLAARTICSCAGVRAGRRYTREMLLGGMLVRSGNDAAEALAGGDPRGRSAFIAAMNRTAARLGATDTVARNPSGLDQSGAHSSARDLLVFLRAASGHPVIAPWLDTTEFEFGPNGGGRWWLQTSTDYVQSYADSYAAKNGYTTDARSTLAAATELEGYPGRRIGVAVLGAPSETASTRDARQLTRWATLNRGGLGPVGRLP